MVLTVKFVQVNLEFACHVGDLLDVMLLDTYSAFLIKHLLMLRQSNGSLEGVSDFSAVEVEIRIAGPLMYSLAPTVTRILFMRSRLNFLMKDSQIFWRSSFCKGG